MQYWQKRRAYRRLPRLRSFPKGSKEPALTSIIGYKAGMTSVVMMEEGPKPTEASRACTIIEVPAIEVYGIRLYRKDKSTGYRHTAAEIYDKGVAQRIGIKKMTKATDGANVAKHDINAYSEVTLLMAASPKGIATGQHHPDRFEVQISGHSLPDKFNYAQKLLGKEVKPADVFKNGEHIDVTSVSTGKGWAGVIKRFGVTRLPHKSTQKVRHVGTLGAFGFGRVGYGVPQSGQMGFNYRTEHNKRVIRVGKKEDTQLINPKSGFPNYGNVISDFIIVDGSIPGPAKRLVRVRKAIDNRDSKGIKDVKVSYIATTGKAM